MNSQSRLERLLSRILPNESRDGVLGDIEEEFAARTLESEAAAQTWKRRQLWHSLVPACRLRLRNTRWLRGALAVLAGYVTLAFPIVLFDLAAASLLPEWMWMTTAYSILTLAFGAAMAMLGGHVTAKLAPGRAPLFSLALLMVGMAAAYWQANGTQWYSLALASTGPFAVLAGGASACRHARR